MTLALPAGIDFPAGIDLPVGNSSALLTGVVCLFTHDKKHNKFKLA
jgi:hypothetical protein